jgi:hypothetical protein
MFDLTIFKGLSDCLGLYFVHAVHRGFRRLCMMCIISQLNYCSEHWHPAAFSGEATSVVEGSLDVRVAVPREAPRAAPRRLGLSGPRFLGA